MEQIISGTYGGNLKWSTVTRNRFISNSAHKGIPPAFFNNDCSMLPVIAYLADHKAATLEGVVKTVRAFNEREPQGHAEILLAAGSAGIEAATNAVASRAWLPMLGLVYGIVAALLLLEFRSWRVTLCLLISLVITSLLREAVMTGLLLTFMFLWNMVGAVVLIPALAAVMGLGRETAGGASFAPTSSQEPRAGADAGDVPAHRAAGPTWSGAAPRPGPALQDPGLG
ncbi:MAG: hypothetical protein EPO01_21270 [Aquabacterium sp.]|nr:MAG: hypothetical protein EPO01_21270 [Aquabacterium sp.]